MVNYYEKFNKTIYSLEYLSKNIRTFDIQFRKAVNIIQYLNSFCVK